MLTHAFTSRIGAGAIPRTARVNPVPLRAGHLLAQQVDDASGGRDLSTWAVHDDPEAAPIGVLTWGRGPRGGRYFSGRLYAWPDGVSVRALTPDTCLVKLGLERQWTASRTRDSVAGVA